MVVVDLEVLVLFDLELDQVNIRNYTVSFKGLDHTVTYANCNLGVDHDKIQKVLDKI